MGRQTGRRVAALATLAITFALGAKGWGDQGHRIVALAAEDLLSKTAAQRIVLFLGKDARLVDFSTWSTQIVAERPETRAWHSIGIPRDAQGVDLDRQCPAGQCITVKLRECIGIVRLGVRKASETADYLKMLVGLAADLHQPALSIGPPERTRISRPVIVGQEAMPLLEVWETGLIELAGTEEDVLDRVKAAIARADQAAWTSGTLRDWTWENHLTARDQIYPLLEGREELVLSAAQVEAATNVVVERLAKSAVRLASILDDVWPR